MCVFQEQSVVKSPTRCSTNITNLITGVTRAACQNVSRNVFKRVEPCVNGDDSMIEHLTLDSTYVGFIKFY